MADRTAMTDPTQSDGKAEHSKRRYRRYRTWKARNGKDRTSQLQSTTQEKMDADSRSTVHNNEICQPGQSSTALSIEIGKKAPLHATEAPPQSSSPPSPHRPGNATLPTAPQDPSPIFDALLRAGYNIPAPPTPFTALDGQALVLFKERTDAVDRLHHLIGALHCELGCVMGFVTWMPQWPDRDLNAWKEGVMRRLFTEVVPALSGLAGRIGEEVERGLRVNDGDVRVLVGGGGGDPYVQKEGRSGEC